MKTIEIKNRFTGEVILSFKCKTVKEAVLQAVKTKTDLRGADLSYADLSEADLSGCNLSGCNLSCVNLSGCNLSGCDLREADLSCVNLRGCNLSGCDLRGSDLSGCDLRGADLRYADLSEADLSGANLDFSSFNLSCNTLKIKSCSRLRIQLAFHFLSLIKNGIDVKDEEKKIYADLMDYANKFHRIDVPKLESL
jgi:uncharacterized protein YjbI with pentapeptide repeats